MLRSRMLTPTESLIGHVPAHWELTTLGDTAARGGGDIQTGPFGSQLHASDYVEDGIPSIMPVNIGDNRIVIDDIARITPADAARLSRYLVQPGTSSIAVAAMSSGAPSSAMPKMAGSAERAACASGWARMARTRCISRTISVIQACARGLCATLSALRCPT